MNDKNDYIWPITPKYKVTEHDKYGIRQNHYVLFKQRQHSGFDITADIGTPVYPVMDGVVLAAEFDGTTTIQFVVSKTTFMSNPYEDREFNTLFIALQEKFNNPSIDINVKREQNHFSRF